MRGVAVFCSSDLLVNHEMNDERVIIFPRQNANFIKYQMRRHDR